MSWDMAPRLTENKLFKLVRQNIEITRLTRNRKSGRITLGLRVADVFKLPDGSIAESVWSAVLREKPKDE